MATEYPVESLNISQIVASLTNTRDPNPHALTMHAAGMPDALKLTDLAVAENVTTLNATTANPGLCPTLSGVATEFLDATGKWSVPAGSGGSGGSSIVLPGSSSVYYDGLGGWSIPAASGSVFKPWLTIGKTGSGADYLCDGTDDNIQFQSAVDAAAPGSEIIVLKGDYYFSSQVSRSNKNLTIKGIGTVNIYLDTGESFGLYFAGSAAASATTLSSSASAGDLSIAVSSASNMAIGQNIIIYNNLDWTPDYPGLKTGEMHEIKAISGTTITLNDPLQRSYSTSNSASAKTFSPVTVELENLNFIGPSATGNQIGVGFRHGNKISVQNCTFKNCALGAIYLYSCYDVDVSQNKTNNLEMAGMGYGVAISTACAKIRVVNNNINSCRHSISCTTDLSQPGMNRDVLVANNMLYGPLNNEGVVDVHPSTLNINVIGNTIYTNGGRGFDDGSQISNFSDNQVFGAVMAVHIRDDINYSASHIVTNNYVKNGSLYYDTSATDIEELTISDNTCLGGDSQIYVYSKDVCRSVKIHNNTLKNASLIAIRVPLENLSAPCVCDISHNTIVDCSQNGIYFDAVSAQNCDITITGNTIRNPNTANGGYSAIQVAHAVGGIINSNKIYDTHGYAGNGITTGTGCDYFAVAGNVVRGVTGTAVSLTGSNNSSDINVSF